MAKMGGNKGGFSLWNNTSLLRSHGTKAAGSINSSNNGIHQDNLGAKGSTAGEVGGGVACS